MPNNINNNKNYVSYSDYVHGNAVRKINTVEVPSREIEKREEKNKTHHTRAINRNREKALHMSLGYVMVLVGCCVAMVAISLQYLRLHDSVANKKKSVAALELNVEQLKSENDAVDYSINSFMDVDYIVQNATQGLGMVRASEGQISFYNNTETEYMKQFMNVPEE